MKRIFITGISTEVGKTVAAAILVEALQADYWKPVQAGDLQTSDSHRIKELISNDKSKIYPNTYALTSPMSPHAAAAIDNVDIRLDAFLEPETSNHLVIEGAGGLLVPLNKRDTILDLIKPHYSVVVVSRHYLGSINHTLLTIERLRLAGHEPVLLFNGDANPATEQVILEKTQVELIGRIEEESSVTPDTIARYAEEFRPFLQAL